MASRRPLRRLTVDEYERMGQVGILREDERVELIEGKIVEMTPIGRRHAGVVNRLSDLLNGKCRDVALVAVQNPVQLSDLSLPQPDVALLRRDPRFYTSRYATPQDVYLLIEVADTTVDSDRRVKVPLYAGSGIAEVWLVDLEQEIIAAYRDPAPEGYRVVQTLRRGERLAPAAFPDRGLAVADMLGDPGT
jgi:Uma2 family endonuclease